MSPPTAALRGQPRRGALGRFARAGLSLLVAAILATYFAQDGPCLITNAASATATATESDWMTFYSKGEEVVKEANSMLENAKASIAKAKEGATSGEKLTEAQIKALAEGWASIAVAKGKFMLAEAHFKDAKSALDKELKSLKKEARKKSLAVPESIEGFSKQVNEMVKAAGAQVKHLDGVLKSAEKSAR